ncbi:AMP-binding protein [Halobacillus seohaensis]|uniref:AMP-binding protein n=1 Tax=Halobacillus seohaensis TaxID=447421 RepID=A0ABW2EJC6_9BACI
MACIGEKIRETANQYPERVAIKTDNVTISYEEFYQSSKFYQQKLASIFSSIKGKKVGFLLPNQRKWLELFIAISSSGGIAIPFDPKWSAAQLKDVIGDAQPDLVIYDQVFDDRVEDIFCSDSVWIDELEGLLNTDENPEQVSDHDPFYIGYTSGTTGQPKGFIRSHASWADCFSLGREVFSLDETDRMLCPGPLVHSHFLYAAVQCLHIGATLHLPSAFDADETWELLQTEDISVMYIVPTMFEALNRIRVKQSSKSLKALISSGAKWQEPSKQAAIQVFPKATIYEFYGASELSFVSYRVVNEESLPEGTIGFPFPKVDISILSDNGKQARQGEVGNLCVKSPWVFDGYLNRPKETNQVFHGNWATVGDLAFVDEEGYVILKGRKQNMIISGGLNIYPEEVEQVIRDHPSIDEAAVIGVEDDYWGEKVVAFVTCTEKAVFTIEDMQKYLYNVLPKYKCPKEWIQVDNFPYTSSGKVARNELRVPARRS